MIYNLANYVKVQLPTLNIVTNGFAKDSLRSSTAISQYGGDPAHDYPRNDWSVQILTRAHTVTEAKYNSELIYDLLKDRIGLELPTVTVDSIVFPLIKTYQISPIQVPGYIGADENNLEMWSFNITVTTK